MRDPAIARGAGTLVGDERAFGSDTDAPAGARPAASRRIVAIVNPATHGNAAAIVDLLHRHAPADADLDVRLTQAAGTTTALTHEALASGARAVVAVGGDGTARSRPRRSTSSFRRGGHQPSAISRQPLSWGGVAGDSHNAAAKDKLMADG